MDDDPRALESVRQLLSAYGYHVEMAASGRAALQRMRKAAFEILLLDLHLDDMSGHEVLDRLRQTGFDTGVIVISGDSSIDAAIESLRRGAQDFVRKPYPPEELLRRVDDLLRRRQLERDNVLFRERLLKSEELYRYLVNSSPDIVYMLDAQGCFTFVNERTDNLLGYGRTELLGLHYSTIVCPDDLEIAEHMLNERRTGKRATRNAEVRLCRKPQDAGRSIGQHDVIAVELNSLGVYARVDKKLRFFGTYGVARDITDRKRAEETISYQAYHDLLTGLPNRTRFNDHLNLALPQAKRNGCMLAVMFLDLDRFKVVNDTLGHPIGDQLLRLVSQRLRECLRAGDTLARIGGDEFLVLLPQIRNHAGAERVAGKIIEAFRRPFAVRDYELFVGASIGISMFPDDSDSADALIRNADVAMYHVKDKGKGSYQFYTQLMDYGFSRHLSVEGELRRAVDDNQLRVFFQPQVRAADGQISGMEALIRWQHPTQGLLPPSEFIAIAEETGCIARLGQWMLESVCAHLCRWREGGLHGVRLSVNLSAREVMHSRFVPTILSILERHGLSGEMLEIEITEHAIMKDLNSVADKLRRLHAHGVRVAIDDFGTGYSSLSYLKQLPIQTLKVDRSFVQDIRPSGDDGSIVGAIVTMALGLGLDLVAEGVETDYQRKRLIDLGCTQMQGFLFSEPVNEQRTLQMLRQGTLAG
ncbi:MAG: EAL domain-containing protein [Chromatiales bacterium]